MRLYLCGCECVHAPLRLCFHWGGTSSRSRNVTAFLVCAGAPVSLPSEESVPAVAKCAIAMIRFTRVFKIPGSELHCCARARPLWH